MSKNDSAEFFIEIRALIALICNSGRTLEATKEIEGTALDLGHHDYLLNPTKYIIKER